MSYPFLPSEWTLPVTQSIYAGLVLLLIQVALSYLVRKCCNSSDSKKLNATQLIAIISIVVLIIEIIVFTTMIKEVTLIHLITIFLSALIPIIILYCKSVVSGNLVE
ncbi:hypothetical protein SAMN05216406_1831 [Nitrosomonas ureae]|uniref:Uncharacterized protein n=1 Tax=Nitrosomonas ureae TaxID=44577 RepID=A0A1H2I0G6_9PROT|nr:hypothetical protein SAMN05216406_1831 [Nitrosomonas ureae]